MKTLFRLAGRLTTLAPHLFPLFAAVVTIPFLLYLPYLFPLSIDNTLDTLLEPDTVQATIDQEVKAAFGELDEVIILAWRPEGDLFTAENLQLLKTLDTRLSHLPGISHVFSLASVPYFRNLPDPDEPGESILDTSPLLDEIPDTAEELAALKETALSHPVHIRNIISPDGESAAFQVILANGLGPADKEQVVRRIRQTVDALATRLGGEFHFSGMHVFMEATGRTMEDDIFRFSLLSALLLFLFLLVSFRGFLLPLLAMCGAGSAVGLLLLTLHACGRSLSIATTPVPAITMGLAIAYSLHFLVSHRDGRLTEPGEREEITASLLLSTLTTMIGFASISLNPIPTLRDLGLFASAGTFFAAMSTLFLVLPALLLLPEVRLPRQRVPGNSRFQAFLIAVTHHHSRAVFLISGLIFLSGGLIFTMEVETDYYRYYRAESAMTRAVDFVNREVGGQYPILVDLQGTQENAIRRPELLDFLHDLQKEFETLPGVDKVVHWGNLLDEGHRAFDESPPTGWYRDTLRLAQVEMIVRDAARALSSCYIDGDNRHTAVFLRTSHINTADFRKLTEHLAQFLKERCPAGFEARVSGTYIRTVNSADRMAVGQFRGTFIALLIIFSLVWLIVASTRLTLIAFTANILPVIGIYGLLAMLGETLNMGTTTIAAIALGIGVDDTIHFLTRYLAACEEETGAEGILKRTLNHSGTAILLTSIAVSLSFIALSLSLIKPLFQLGVFTAVAMALCVVADLFLLPVLLVLNGKQMN